MLRISVILIALCLLGGLNHCTKDDAPGIEKKQLDQLTAKVWTTVSASLDGQNRNDVAGMTLTVSGPFTSKNPKGPYNYVTEGGKPPIGPWPKTGTFTFGDKPVSELLREDGIQIEYSIQTNGHLIMQFACVTCNYASRSTGVNGDWIFEFE